MGRKRKIDVKVPKDLRTRDPERDKLMLLDWVQNRLSFQELADKYGVTKGTVIAISKKYDWKRIRKQLIEREFAHALHGVFRLGARVMVAADKHWDQIDRKLAKGEELGEKELTHMRFLIDRLLKERRLEDGKPTGDEPAGGVHEVRIILPDGKKEDDFGVIPGVGHGVKIVEAEIVEEDETEEVDIDGLSDDLASIKPAGQESDDDDKV
jgi:hypothetical protein